MPADHDRLRRDDGEPEDTSPSVNDDPAAVKGPPSGEGRQRTVLVTDGVQRSSLAAVRSLGRAGFEVLVCSDREPSLAGSSRYCRGTRRVADPLTEPDGYVADVARIVADEEVEVVLPMTEASLLALLPERARLSPSVLPFGDHGSFTRLLDKEEVLRRAPRHGIAVPEQVVLEGPTAAVRGLPPGISFPVVLKPRRSIGVSDGTRQSVGVTHVMRPSEFEEIVNRQPAASFPLLVQERIEGPGVGIFLLLDRRGTVARFAHRRLREKPPSGGVSVLRESVRPDDSLFERARSLLEDFGWEGVAMVEFKVSEESGEPYLMEVNPRLWGSLQLAIDAGVDFPALLVRGALGEPVPRGEEYAAGVRTRWFWGEVDHFLARLREVMRREERPTGKVLAEMIGSFVTGWGGGTHLEVFRWSDPGPFLRESVAWWKDVVEGGSSTDA